MLPAYPTVDEGGTWSDAGTHACWSRSNGNGRGIAAAGGRLPASAPPPTRMLRLRVVLHLPGQCCPVAAAGNGQPHRSSPQLQDRHRPDSELLQGCPGPRRDRRWRARGWPRQRWRCPRWPPGTAPAGTDRSRPRWSWRPPARSTSQAEASTHPGPQPPARSTQPAWLPLRRMSAGHAGLGADGSRGFSRIPPLRRVRRRSMPERDVHAPTIGRGGSISHWP
jgi:hypothetical protein